jgi:hypothetical protein
MDREDLVSVYSVNNPMEAEIIRNALHDAGIACEIGGETQAGLAGVLEIDILTHVGDADAARKYLRTLRHVTKQERKQAHEAKEAKRMLNEGIQESKPTDIQLPPE